VTASAVAAARRRHTGRFASLRPLQADDAALTLRWRLSDRAVLLNRGSTTVEEQRAWIEGRPDNELNYVIETADGTPLGMLSLIDIDATHGRAEAARFLLGEEERARGLPIAVEAMLLLYRVAFDELGLTRVYGTVVEDNPRMLKWQMYLGMQVEGRLRRHISINGHLQDVVLVGILEPEFREVALPRMRGLIALAGPNTPTEETDT
jgi:RimJ/RimL family protein N-acetyltransferase